MKPRIFRYYNELDVILPGAGSSMWTNVRGGKVWHHSGYTLDSLVHSPLRHEISLCEARRILRQAGMTLPK